jgi:hypothetical protein
MNIRNELDKKKRIVWLSVFGGMGLIFASSFLMPSDQQYLIIVGTAVFIFAIFYSHFGINCPICKGNTGHIVMYSSSLFKSSKNIKYCPCCGVNIDTGINRNIS